MGLAPSCDDPGERLISARRRGVGLDARFDGGELAAKQLEDLLGGVALDRQSGALRWPVGGEGGDDRVAARRERYMQGFRVGSSVAGINEEVQHGTVMPNA